MQQSAAHVWWCVHRGMWWCSDPVHAFVNPLAGCSNQPLARCCAESRPGLSSGVWKRIRPVVPSVCSFARCWLFDSHCRTALIRLLHDASGWRAAADSTTAVEHHNWAVFGLSCWHVHVQMYPLLNCHPSSSWADPATCLLNKCAATMLFTDEITEDYW